MKVEITNLTRFSPKCCCFRQYMCQYPNTTATHSDFEHELLSIVLGLYGLEDGWEDIGGELHCIAVLALFCLPQLRSSLTIDNGPDHRKNFSLFRIRLVAGEALGDDGSEALGLESIASSGRANGSLESAGASSTRDTADSCQCHLQTTSYDLVHTSSAS